HLDEQLSFDRPDLPTLEAEEFGIEGRRRGRRILLKAVIMLLCKLNVWKSVRECLVAQKNSEILNMVIEVSVRVNREALVKIIKQNKTSDYF
ncbi:MAG: hypothetical protein ACTS68_01825, partial [Candidatus Hodgkinia cicadicola]